MLIFKHAEKIPRGSLNIAIDAEMKARNGLTGIYDYHSLYKNIGAYIRAGGKIDGLSGDRYFLVYFAEYGEWYFQGHDRKFCFLHGGSGGYLRVASKGFFDS